MQGLIPLPSAAIQIISTSSSKAALASVIAQFDRLSEQRGDSVQILCALHKGRLGTVALNRAISGNDEIAIGELVMQIRNDRERGIFNGEIGTVTDRSLTGLTMVRDDGTTFFYKNSELSQLRRAWAISFHKSQGLEYEHVIMIVSRSHLSMLNRNMINVGITRAKKTCVIIDHANALAQAVARNTGESRTTLLTDLMQGRNPLA
ncbi:ATP-dependent DNA helicase [Microvirga tunisiensis]|nr:ATP-dependent RecD-like DNA helicase [Microvirga tunisiensis]